MPEQASCEALNNPEGTFLIPPSQIYIFDCTQRTILFSGQPSGMISKSKNFDAKSKGHFLPPESQEEESEDDDVSLESRKEESKDELEDNENEGSGQISDNRYRTPSTMSPSLLQL